MIKKYSALKNQEISSDSTEEELKEYARGFAGQSLGNDDVEFYIWEYDESFPIEELWTKEGAHNWLNDENLMLKEEGHPIYSENINDYGDIYKNPPIIVKDPIKGSWDIWDGNHRTAIAIISGLKFMPVVVGIPAEDFIK